MDGIAREIKLVRNEGIAVHRARGFVTHEDDHFITLLANGRLITVSKVAIVKVVREPVSETRTPPCVTKHPELQADLDSGTIPDFAELRSRGLCDNPDDLCLKVESPLSYFRIKGKIFRSPQVEEGVRQ